MLKECNLVLLPEGKKAEGCLIQTSYHTFEYTGCKSYFTQQYLRDNGLYAYHLYITCDAPIVSGDKVFVEKYPQVWEFQPAPCPMPYWGNPKVAQKIIAGTNRELRIPGSIAPLKAIWKTDGVLLPFIPEAWLYKFVSECDKGKEITKVLVDFETVTGYDDEGQPMTSTGEIYHPGLVKLNDNAEIDIRFIKTEYSIEEVKCLLRTQYHYLGMEKHFNTSAEEIESLISKSL